jgi:hypothetical protein
MAHSGNVQTPAWDRTHPPAKAQGNAATSVWPIQNAYNKDSGKRKPDADAGSQYVPTPQNPSMKRAVTPLRCSAGNAGKRHNAYPNAGQIKSAPQWGTRPSIHSPASKPANAARVAAAQKLMWSLRVLKTA